MLAEYDGDRALCAEAWLPTLEQTALWVRPDEMHQAFNFPYLETEWDAAALRDVIDESLAAFAAVGAPSTWVLSNHDVVRHASRLALTAENPQGHGIGPDSPGKPTPTSACAAPAPRRPSCSRCPARRTSTRARSSACPRSSTSPTTPARTRRGSARTASATAVTDAACRCPWTADAPAYGFSATGDSWLPQPAEWAELARDVQAADPASTLALYRACSPSAARTASARARSSGSTATATDVVAFRNGTCQVVANIGDDAGRRCRDGIVIAASGPIAGRRAARRHDGLARRV